MRQVSSQERPQVRKPGAEYRINLRISPAKTNAIKKEEDRTQMESFRSGLTARFALNHQSNRSVIDELYIHHSPEHPGGNSFAAK